MARLGVWCWIEVEGSRHFSLGRLIAGKEIRHEVHHVLELHVNLLEVFIEFSIVWVFTARGRGVALARIVLQFVTYLHLHDKVGKPLRLLHIFPVSLIIALAQSLTAIPGGGPYTP